MPVLCWVARAEQSHCAEVRQERFAEVLFNPFVFLLRFCLTPLLGPSCCLKGCAQECHFCVHKLSLSLH